MNNIGCPVIYFDYGGFYLEDGDDVNWNRKEARIYTLLINEALEELSYNELVARILRKVKVDDRTTKVKLSYIPLVVEPKIPSYILDDDDVLGYLMDVTIDQRRSVLHVEVMEAGEQISFGQFSRVERVTGVDVTNEEFFSDARAEDGNLELNTASQPSVECQEMGIVPLPDADMHYDHDLPEDEGEIGEWEDGIGLTIGEEFTSKQAVQDLVERAVHRNCFEVSTIKSSTTLYVLKCREDGCKWSLRSSQVLHCMF